MPQQNCNEQVIIKDLSLGFFGGGGGLVGCHSLMLSKWSYPATSTPHTIMSASVSALGEAASLDVLFCIVLLCADIYCHVLFE